MSMAATETALKVGDRVYHRGNGAWGEGQIVKVHRDVDLSKFSKIRSGKTDEFLVKWSVPDALTGQFQTISEAKDLRRIPTGDEPEDKGRPVTCQCCEWKGGENEVRELRDVWERVQPGDVMPAGECPECGMAAMLLVETAVAPAPVPEPWTKTESALPPGETSVQGWWDGGDQAVAFYRPDNEDDERTGSARGWYIIPPLDSHASLVEAAEPPRYWKLLDDPQAEVRGGAA